MPAAVKAAWSYNISDSNVRRSRTTKAPGRHPSGGPRSQLPETNEPWGQVTIRGDAEDNVAVATFVVGLRDSGLFRRVELKSCARSPSGGSELRSYVLECEL